MIYNNGRSDMKLNTTHVTWNLSFLVCTGWADWNYQAAAIRLYERKAPNVFAFTVWPKLELTALVNWNREKWLQMNSEKKTEKKKNLNQRRISDKLNKSNKKKQRRGMP